MGERVLTQDELVHRLRFNIDRTGGFPEVVASHAALLAENERLRALVARVKGERDALEQACERKDHILSLNHPERGKR